MYRYLLGAGATLTHFIDVWSDAPSIKQNAISGYLHRNLGTRKSMFALVLQKFVAKKLVKSLLISTLDKVIYFIGNNFSGLFNTSLYFTK
jgi:hypothetical protein